MATLSLGQWIELEGRQYEVRDIQDTAIAYPNIKKAYPKVMQHIVIKGKRGALKAAIVMESGNIRMM